MLNILLEDIISTKKEYYSALKEMGLNTLEDLLLYFPRDYEDLSEYSNLSKARNGEKITMRGVITGIVNAKSKKGMALTKAKFYDNYGEEADVIWFNQPFLCRTLLSGSDVIVAGKTERKYGRVTFLSPTVEKIKVSQVHTGGVVPIYPAHDVITTKWLREKIKPLLSYAKYFEENLPKEIILEEGLVSRSDAVKEIHFPTSKKSLEKARERLAYEELFFLQMEAVKRKMEWKNSRPADSPIGEVKMNVDFVKNFFSTLPFTPTGAQKVAIYEILSDFEKPYPMMRLLEGDVGSGKTVVAVVALLNAVLSGYQVCIMAPTEVLARQHMSSIVKMIEKYEFAFPGKRPINIQLLVGSLKSKEKQFVQDGIKNGLVDIAIGTHALAQEAVKFDRLGLAIVDEQHRFGVKQREALMMQGSPHVLNMTATPIPRTLAMVAYGDHDLSVLNEMPTGRQPIITRVIVPEQRQQVNVFIADRIKKGEQAYVICPLIEQSEKLEVKSVKDEYEKLHEVFPDFKIGLLHGRMKAEEKEDAMKRFKDGEIQIFVSTSVIEVGIDVPNATIMLIEGSERFGLSQLHQFRGRVGRGSQKSYCFLCTSPEAESSFLRLKAMVDHSDGFKLAEIDMKLRGPGEVYGVRQSGIPDLKVANMSNGVLVARVRKAAEYYAERL